MTVERVVKAVTVLTEEIVMTVERQVVDTAMTVKRADNAVTAVVD